MTPDLSAAATAAYSASEADRQDLLAMGKVAARHFVLYKGELVETAQPATSVRQP